jgi:hypothetical protein
VPRLALATRCATFCLQTHPTGDLPLIMRDVIGRQPWISLYSNTGRGINTNSFIEYPTRMHSFFNSRGEINYLNLDNKCLFWEKLNML